MSEYKVIHASEEDSSTWIWDMSDVKVPSSESFIISEYPPDRPRYWDFVCTREIDISVQCHVMSKYHLDADEVYIMNNGESVRLESNTESDGVRHRIYIIESVNKGNRLFHNFSLRWPDLGVPNVDQYTKFLVQYSQLVTSPGMKVHVHCWGGHGRSGTFVLTRALIVSGNVDDYKSILENMRKQRSYLVETSAQEKFARQSALNYIQHIETPPLLITYG